MFESFPIYQNDKIETLLDLSTDRKDRIIDLEKSILTQNKLISQQISRFFEYTKDNYYKSMGYNGRPVYYLKNQVKKNYNYSYIPDSEKSNNMNWSFKKSRSSRQKTLTNISLALDRDSLKNIEVNHSRKNNQTNGSKRSKEKNEATPKLYSKNTQKQKNQQNKHIAQLNGSRKKYTKDEVSPEDFATLGKEGNTIWLPEESGKKANGKYQILGKVSTNSNKMNIFKNFKFSPKITKTEYSKSFQQVTKVDKDVLEKKQNKFYLWIDLSIDIATSC